MYKYAPVDIISPMVAIVKAYWWKVRNYYSAQNVKAHNEYDANLAADAYLADALMSGDTL